MLGAQRPRLEHIPPYLTNEDADDAIELSALAGLVLDPWQERVFRHSLGVNAAGKWAAFEVACIVPRQNGKGSIIEARELAGLFLFGERLIIHTAHEFKTSIEAFKRIEKLIRQTPQLVRQVKGFNGDPMGRMAGIKTGNGFQSITLDQKYGGGQIQFLARSTGSGRGFTADLVILDEAYALTSLQVDAIVPTLSARTIEHNPQLWYLSSAGLVDSDVLAGIKERGTSEDPGGIYYAEFSVDETAPGFDPGDPAQWLIANPAAGKRIDLTAIANEYRSMGLDGFLRERLGVWEKVGGTSVVPRSYWDASLDEDSDPGELLALAIDVPPDRSSASVCLAGYRDDDERVHVELIDRRPGLDWVVPFIVRLRDKLGPVAIVVDAGGAAGALLPDFRAARVRTLQLTAREYGQSCGRLFDLIMSGGLAHIGQEELDEAIDGARRSPMGDSLWRWSRKDSLIDISPLCGVTLAVHGLERRGKRRRAAVAAGGSATTARKAVIL